MGLLQVEMWDGAFEISIVRCVRCASTTYTLTVTSPNQDEPTATKAQNMEDKPTAIKAQNLEINQRQAITDCSGANPLPDRRPNA